jgi:PhzF family phenazine biosynthesis protein
VDHAEVVHTLVFAASPQGGNPCPVVPDADGMDDTTMQALARRFGLDTVFIMEPNAKTADVRLRYFVPDHEMGVSGHATVAALTVALKRGLRPQHARVETTSGLFEFGWLRKNGGYVVTFEQNSPVIGPTISAAQVAPVLKIGIDDIASNESPIQAVSVSRPKLIVPIRDWQTLDNLEPDFDALWRLCDTEQVSGLYPFTRHTDKSADAEARQFPLRAGFPEDAATGVAAAALAAYLTKYDLKNESGHHRFRVAQGYAMGAPSLIEAIAECANGQITGTAIRGAAEIVRYEDIPCGGDT